MVTYIYFVKCPNCEDEHFDFFDEAKEFALGCLSQKPIITQTEVCRNDFGECTDSADLGTVWSWEEVMKDTEAEPTESVFTKDDLKRMADGKDPEFDNIDNSVDFEIDEVSEKEPINEESVPRHPVVAATRAPKASEYVIVFKHPNTGKYYLLGRNYTMTTDINKAMTYPGKFSAEDEIKYAEDAADKHGFNFTAKTGGYDSYGDFSWIKFPKDNPDQYYDDYRSVNFFVTTVAEAEKLLDTKDTVKSNTLVRKPIPEGMTIEQLVEEMEENEDEVECTLCQDLFDKAQCKKELNLGWLCDRCASGLIARGEQPVFKENTYWDFLDEKLDIDFSNCVDSSDMEIWGLEHVQEDIYKAVLLKRFENVNYRSQEDEYQKVVDEMYDIDGAFTFSFGKNGLPELGSWNVNLLRKLGSIRIDFEDNHYENAVAKVFNRKTLKEEMSLTDLVKDSINHLVNDLGKDPLADDFADDVIGDLERNYYTEVPEGFTKYQEWCSAVASEVSRQVNNPDNLTEASLSDIAAAANSEFGTSWDDDYILDTAGVDDDFNIKANAKTVLPKTQKSTWVLVKPNPPIEVPAELIDCVSASDEAWAHKILRARHGSWYNKGWQLLSFEDACKRLTPEDCERTKHMDESLTENSMLEDIESKELHDLGNEYDGAYPDKKPELPETDEVSDFKLTVCPECGEEAFDAETGICIACGFM